MGQKGLVFEIHLVEKPRLNKSSLAFAKRGFALRARLASLGINLILSIASLAICVIIIENNHTLLLVISLQLKL